MKLKVYASLAEDINSGWVWLPEALAQERQTVYLRNTATNQSVYCEALQIGENFVKRYNRNMTLKIDNDQVSVVMNEWYRQRLGIPKTGAEIEFEITRKDSAWGHLCACLHHPQIVVRLATKLAILSVLLGILGIVLGGLSLSQ